LRKQADLVDERAKSSTTSPDAVEYAGSSDPSMVGQLVSKVKAWATPSNTSPEKATPTKDKQPSPAPPQATTEDIANALNAASLHATSFRIALQHSLKLNMPGFYAQVIVDLTKLTKDSATSWALLINWLLEQDDLKSLLNRHSDRLLRNQLKLVNSQIAEIAKNSFEKFILEQYKN
jgi:hypothetical protein